MTIKKNTFPNIAHKEAKLILLSEWTGDESDLIKSMDISMDEVESAAWPDGLISYSCFLSSDKNRVLHCAQWESQDDHLKYVENHLPERLKILKDGIVVESEKSFGRFKLKESRLGENTFTTEFIAIALESESLALRSKPQHISEYVLKNIDNGKSLLYADLAGLDGDFVLNPGVNIYSLLRSYVNV